MRTYVQLLLPLIILIGWPRSLLAQAHVVPQHGHSAAINHLTYSPSGTFLSSASEDNTVRVWASDGNIVALLGAHKAPVVHSAFLSDQHLISIDRDGVVLGWDILSEDSSTIADFDGIVPLQGNDILALAETNSHIAVAGYRNFHWAELPPNWMPGQALTFTDVRTGFDVDAIAISPSGHYIAAVSKIGDVYIYDTSTKKQIFREMLEPIFTRAKFVNNEFLALAGRGVSLFSIDKQRIVNTIAGDDTLNTIGAMAVDPTDGSIAAIAEKLEVVNADTKQSQFSVDSVAGTAVAYAPDGERIAVVDNTSADCLADHTRIRILSAEGEQTAQFSPGLNAQPKADVSQDGLLAISSCSQQVQLWDLRQRKLIRSMKGLTSKIERVHYSTGDNAFLVLDADGALHRWSHAGKNSKVKTLKAGLGLTDLAFSADGSAMAYSERDADGITQVFLEQVESGEQRRMLPKTFASQVERIRFSPSADMVTVHTENDAVLAFPTQPQAFEDSPAGSRSLNLGRMGLNGARIMDYAFNPASEQVVIAYETRLELWSSQSFTKINMTPAKYSGIEKIAFSQDGGKFALITNRRLVLYKAADLSVIAEIGSAGVTDAFFTGDDQLLLVNSDGRVDVYATSEAPEKIASIQNINDKYGYAIDAKGNVISLASDKVAQPILSKTVEGEKIHLEVIASKNDKKAKDDSGK